MLARLPWETAPTISELAGLVERPAWQRDAACREHPEVDFFPGGKPANVEHNAGPALAVCRSCLVRHECLALALASPDLVGVWGATTEAQRRALRRAEARLPANECERSVGT